MALPLLSVVIPCRLSGSPGLEMRRAFLRLCLQALDRQTASRESFEVVIVDDAGDIDLAEFVAGFAGEHPTLNPRVLRNPGPVHGLAAAYNLGARHARGTHVLLTSDDTLLAPEAVEAHLRAHAALSAPAYVCGIERQYLYGILFRDIITGELHGRDDLSVRTFGALLGIPDIRRTAEFLGHTGWTVTPEDVRSRFGELYRRSALTPNFRDMYRELGSDRTDLRWLCVRVGNHSIERSAFLGIGGLEESVPGVNSDQDLGLKLEAAGIAVLLEPGARSILVEHWRNLRSFADATGLARLAERWPREDVVRLHEFFSRGYDRSIAGYRAALTTPRAR